MLILVVLPFYLSFLLVRKRWVGWTWWKCLNLWYTVVEGRPYESLRVSMSFPELSTLKAWCIYLYVATFAHLNIWYIWQMCALMEPRLMIEIFLLPLHVLWHIFSAQAPIAWYQLPRIRFAFNQSHGLYISLCLTSFIQFNVLPKSILFSY